MSAYTLLPGPHAPARLTRCTAALHSRPLRLAAALATAAVLLVSLASLTAAPATSVRVAKAAIDRTASTVQAWVGKAAHDHGDDDDPEQPPYELPTVQDLRTLVGENPRYLTKDGWATYGYNNQRYMLEATLTLARATDRIPVLPDAVWARSCAVEPDSVCAENALAYFQHRNEHESQVAAKWNADGPAYKLAIEHFIDIPHLRSTYGPFLLYSEYFALYNLSASLLDESLRWRPDRYTPPGFKSVTMPESEFQNDTFARTDRPAPARTDPEVGFDSAGGGGRLEQLSRSKVADALSARPAWSLLDARQALQKAEVLESDGISDAALVRMLEPVGVVALHTYSDYVLMNKALSHPTVELALATRVRALSTALEADPYREADIVYLAGNLHDQRKPGGCWFSTADARDQFTQTVVRGIRAPREIRTVGARLAERMQARTTSAGGGRQRSWMAAHLRRGDFVEIAWSPARDPRVHFDKLVAELEVGRAALAEHAPSDRLDSVSRQGDPFYLATDETNSTSLAYFRSRGAVLLSDLLTPADSDLLSWPGHYADVLSVVEQEVLGRASYFVGSELSSTTGGAVNVRTRHGKPQWSWSVLLRGTDLGARQDDLR
ncbi:hypothetical protein JCM3774_000415 [Rhodotorula dairenensis]